MTEREILLKKLSSYQFSAYDLRLYLDTHPYDSETVKKLRELEGKYESLKTTFEDKFGPLKASDSGQNRWKWIKSPWPWENEEDE